MTNDSTTEPNPPVNTPRFAAACGVIVAAIALAGAVSFASSRTEPADAAQVPASELTGTAADEAIIAEQDAADDAAKLAHDEARALDNEAGPVTEPDATQDTLQGESNEIALPPQNSPSPAPDAPQAPDAPLAPPPVTQPPTTEPPTTEPPTTERAPQTPDTLLPLEELPAPEEPAPEAPTPEEPAPEEPAPEAPAPDDSPQVLENPGVDLDDLLPESPLEQWEDSQQLPELIPEPEPSPEPEPTPEPLPQLNLDDLGRPTLTIPGSELNLGD